MNRGTHRITENKTHTTHTTPRPDNARSGSERARGPSRNGRTTPLLPFRSQCTSIAATPALTPSTGTLLCYWVQRHPITWSILRQHTLFTHSASFHYTGEDTPRSLGSPLALRHVLCNSPSSSLGCLPSSLLTACQFLWDPTTGLGAEVICIAIDSMIWCCSECFVCQ